MPLDLGSMGTKSSSTNTNGKKKNDVEWGSLLAEERLRLEEQHRLQQEAAD
jgi:hypothetical protein